MNDQTLTALRTLDMFKAPARVVVFLFCAGITVADLEGHEKCSKEVNATSSTLTLFLDILHAESMDFQVPDHTEKCYMYCIFREVGEVNEEGHYIGYDHHPNLTQQEIEDEYRCVGETKEIPDKCERVYELLICEKKAEFLHHRQTEHKSETIFN